MDYVNPKCHIWKVNKDKISYQDSSHERDNIEKNLKKLVKENLVLQHPTSYGMQYALNSQRLQDIMKILGIDLD